MFKPKSFVCKWCGARHYKGSKVARYHAKMLKKFGYKKAKPKTKKQYSYKKTILLYPHKPTNFKIIYGYDSKRNKYFIETWIRTKRKPYYRLQKRKFYKKKSGLFSKIIKYNKYISNLHTGGY